jgi:hypothetical protein
VSKQYSEFEKENRTALLSAKKGEKSMEEFEENKRKREEKMEENISKLQGDLIPDLVEFDRAICPAKMDNNMDVSRMLQTYNICGDKALHMCMLMAYRYGQGSSNMRDVFINLAKELIEKREQQYGQDAAPTGQNSGFHADVQPNGQDASLSRKSSTWQR